MAEPKLIHIPRLTIADVPYNGVVYSESVFDQSFRSVYVQDMIADKMFPLVMCPLRDENEMPAMHVKMVDMIGTVIDITPTEVIVKPIRDYLNKLSKFEKLMKSGVKYKCGFMYLGRFDRMATVTRVSKMQLKYAFITEVTD